MSSPYLLQKQAKRMATTKDNRKPLTDEQKAIQREKASCFLTITFNDGNKFSKWSNEWQQPHKGNINVWINEMFRVFDEHFRKDTYEAAIFDTRFKKNLVASEHNPECNKIYQFERGSWRLVQPLNW